MSSWLWKPCAVADGILSVVKCFPEPRLCNIFSCIAVHPVASLELEKRTDPAEPVA